VDVFKVINDQALPSLFLESKIAGNLVVDCKTRCLPNVSLFLSSSPEKNEDGFPLRVVCDARDDDEGGGVGCVRNSVRKGKGE